MESSGARIQTRANSFGFAHGHSLATLVALRSILPGIDPEMPTSFLKNFDHTIPFHTR